MTCRVTTDAAWAADVLRSGGLVALPTETVYGLGADATNPTAVARIFAAKQRPAFDPLIVHLASLAHWQTVATELPPRAAQLAARFWPGPLTLVLPKQSGISDLVTSGLPTVGVRVPRHPLMQAVLELADCPIAAPSANRFGRLSPTRPEHVVEQLGNVIDLILDGGPCAVGVESTIVRPDVDGVTILRLGGLSVEDIAAVAGPVRLAATESSTAPEAPGMLPQHYAPRTPIALVPAAPVAPSGSRWGLLTLRPIMCDGYVAIESLTADGDLILAAARFFAALHRLDKLGLDRIIAVEFPEHGLGRAINDRLRRAAATY
ncbi:MAG: L-threonylcarbamoyladenylate synthase [Planctomycetaceae bacterium]|nr:L-threonylcarbamoyladenylate synthase [Planctomycetaceae bacterium]